jgi:uncharacterized protein YecT (DUF1311 family)
MPRLFVAVSLLLLICAAQASGAEPSFDCGTAKTAREMATCRDAKLAAADRAMAAAWPAAIARLDATTAKALRDDQRQFISAIDDGFDNQLWGKAGPPDSASERRKAVAALRRGPDDDTPETDALPTLEAQLNQRAAFLKALTPASAAAPFAGLWKNFGGELLIEPSVMAAARSAPDNNAFRVTLGVASFGFAKYQCHFAGVFKLTGDALLAQSAHNNDLDEDIIDNLRIRRDGSTVTIDDDVPHQAKGDDPYTICPRVPNLTGPLFHTSLSAAQGHHLKPEDDD